MAEAIRKELLEKQEAQFENLKKEAGVVTKEEFVAKMQADQVETKKAATKSKPKAKTEKKEQKPKAPAKAKMILGVKDLEAEFGLTGKTIRRHLRKMEENKKPRGPEPYQWFADDPGFKKIRENLKAVIARQPKLQVK
jgi:hypothetical protein